MESYFLRRFLALAVRLVAGCCLLFAAVEVAGWIGRARGIEPPALAQGTEAGTAPRAPYSVRVLLAVASPSSTVTAGDGQARGVWPVTLAALRASLPWIAGACLASLSFGIPLGLALGRRRWLAWGAWPVWLTTWLPVAWLAIGTLWWAVDHWRIPMMDFEAGDSQREMENWRGFLAALFAVLPAVGWQVMRVARAVASESVRGWVEWGRLRGQPPGRVFYRHVIRHAAAPMLLTLPETLPAMVGALAVAEWVLGYPGYGWLVVEAARQRQIVVLCAAVLIGLAIMVTVRAVAELVQGWADPRVREKDGLRQEAPH